MNNRSGKLSFFEVLIELNQNKISGVLVTVLNSFGSTPQKPGSTAIWSENGLVAGTIGGGSVENAISKLIPQALKNKQSGYYKFSLNHDINDPTGSICGGGMNILVDASPENSLDMFAEVEKSIQNHEHGVLVTDFFPSESNFPDSDKILISRTWVPISNQSSLSGFPLQVADVITSQLISNRVTECLEITVKGFKGVRDKIYFLEHIKPLPRLFIAGAGHVGKALSHFGKLLDFEVIVWDDRPEYSNYENLPDASLILSCSPENLTDYFTPCENSFIVIVTRGHRQDAEILQKFIGRNARYIGMMGSKRKILQIKEKFLTENWTTIDEWNKIHTPVGMEINSVTVQEIAVSIAAELVKVRNNTNG